MKELAATVNNHDRKLADSELNLKDAVGLIKTLDSRTVGQHNKVTAT